MQYEEKGRITRGLGGLYEIRLEPAASPRPSDVIQARAKGTFRHEGVTPLVGDLVRVLYEDSAFDKKEDGRGSCRKDGGCAVIEEILPRKNALIRPPLANLDLLFIAFAAADPAPVTETVDKLISIAEFHGIEPVVVITKSELNQPFAAELAAVYENAGFSVFCLSAKAGEGVAALRDFVTRENAGKIAAFAGASGVGKSTLINSLFPDLQLETGEISRKTARGKHTTRRAELYPLAGGFLADTPGFSMLDFVRFDFFTCRDLPFTMREFAPYIGECRYTKCTHTKEEGCAVLAALKKGDIAKSRHDSFLAMYGALKNKTEWGKK